MEVGCDDAGVSIALSRGEVSRLAVAIAAGYETVSRAEYFIRTGLSQPSVAQIVAALFSATDPSHRTLALEPAVEAVENPQRPRPRH
jgi:hypothetical protein